MPAPRLEPRRLRAGALFLRSVRAALLPLPAAPPAGLFQRPKRIEERLHVGRQSGAFAAGEHDPIGDYLPLDWHGK